MAPSHAARSMGAARAAITVRGANGVMTYVNSEKLGREWLERIAGGVELQCASELHDRMDAIQPVIADKLCGRNTCGSVRARRNVAEHNFHVQMADVTLANAKAVQRGNTTATASDGSTSSSVDEDAAASATMQCKALEAELANVTATGTELRAKLQAQEALHTRETSILQQKVLDLTHSVHSLEDAAEALRQDCMAKVAVSVQRQSIAETAQDEAVAATRDAEKRDAELARLMEEHDQLQTKLKAQELESGRAEQAVSAAIGRISNMDKQHQQEVGALKRLNSELQRRLEARAKPGNNRR